MGRKTAGAVLNLRDTMQAAAFGLFIGAVGLENFLWNETMNQSPDEFTQATWGQCEGCQKNEFLLPVSGHGNLCCGCECDLICSDIEAQIKAVRAA